MMRNCLLGLLVPTLLFAQHLEAETMPIKTGGALRALGWALFSNGYVAQTVNFVQSGRHHFTLRASGSRAAGEWPKAELRIDQIVVTTIEVDSPDYDKFAVAFHVEAGWHELAIAFINDFYDPSGDRNLYIDWLHIDPDNDVIKVKKNPVSFKWIKNSEDDIYSYRFYIGAASRRYDYFIATTDTSLQYNFPTNFTRFVAVTAMDTAGNESDYSNEIKFVVPSATSPPPVFGDSLYVEWNSPATYTNGVSMPRDGVLYYNLFAKDSLGVEVKLNSLVIGQTVRDPVFWAGEVKLSPGRYNLYVESAGREGIGMRSAPIPFTIEKTVILLPGAPSFIKVKVRRFAR